MEEVEGFFEGNSEKISEAVFDGISGLISEEFRFKGMPVVIPKITFWGMTKEASRGVLERITGGISEGIPELLLIWLIQ